MAKAFTNKQRVKLFLMVFAMLLFVRAVTKECVYVYSLSAVHTTEEFSILLLISVTS